MHYNNISKGENLALKVLVTRTYTLSKCIINSTDDSVYTNISIPSITISSDVIEASGKYTRESESDNYFIRGDYKAQYNFGKLSLINVKTGASIIGQLDNIEVICSDNSAANGNYIKYDLNEWRKSSNNNYILYNNKVISDNNSLYVGEYNYSVVDGVYKKGNYELYEESGIWYLKNSISGEFISPFNVEEAHTLETFNNFLSTQSNVTIRNSIYSHARLFNYNIDSIEGQSGSNNNTSCDYLNYCVSSNLNFHDNVILNIQRRKTFRYVEDCSVYDFNKQDDKGEWCEYRHKTGNDTILEKLLDQYTRKNGTVITDFLIGLVQTVNGSVISNNNFSYLYTDNVYKKIDNIGDDFYNLPQDVIDNEKSTGGCWYRAYDRFYSRTLFKQLNTYAEYSKLMLNNGNIPYWDIRNGEGLFYESGVIIFECGYNETITNYTNRIIKFIESLPTNLNGCEVTFIFKSYGDQEIINLSSTIYFDNFYNGVIRIVGISQNKTNIISNDFTKPIFSFTNVDNVYIDNIKFDYNFYNNGIETIKSSSCTLEFENINNVEIISTEVCNVFTYIGDGKSKEITSCGILANNSNVTISGLEVKRCYSVLKGINNSKFNVSGLNLSIDSISQNSNYPSIIYNWHRYYKYLIELQNNSIGYIKMDKCVVSSSQQFYWRISSGASNEVAVNIERGSMLNHTHVGLNPIYSDVSGGSIITPINSQSVMNDSNHTNGTSFSLNKLCQYRYNDVSGFNSNSSKYKFDNVTLDNLHFYRSVDFNNSQLPIGDIVEWLSINKYDDSVNLWESELNMWPWGFYPCYEKYYPVSMRGKTTTANGGESKCINIPINGHDVNDYFYNVPLAIKMGYLINNSNSNTDYVKNYFAIPNFKPTLVLAQGEYFVRKIKIIKYSEKVEDRS